MQNPVRALSPEEFAARFTDLHPPFAPQAAAVEASRCLFCFDAPCTAACPTHIDVPRFIKKISTGNLRGSALTILDANILGLSCSRVSPASAPAPLRSPARPSFDVKESPSRSSTGTRCPAA